MTVRTAFAAEDLADSLAWPLSVVEEDMIAVVQAIFKGSNVGLGHQRSLGHGPQLHQCRPSDEVLVEVLVLQTRSCVFEIAAGKVLVEAGTGDNFDPTSSVTNDALDRNMSLVYRTLNIGLDLLVTIEVLSIVKELIDLERLSFILSELFGVGQVNVMCHNVASTKEGVTG